MASNNKGYEIDERAWEIIKKNVLELSVLFPHIQDINMYKREAVKVLDKTKVEIKEKVLINGRTDNSARTTAAN